MSRVDVYQALGDETRRLILDGLAERDGQTLFEICSLLSARGIGTSRQGISQHVAVLVQAGLVTVHRRGRSNFHHFDREPLRQIQKRWPTDEEQP